MTTPTNSSATDPIRSEQTDTPAGAPGPDATATGGGERDPQDTTAEGHADTTEADEQDSPNSEAAKRRRQLRATQTELATTRDQLSTYQRRHAEQAIADVLTVPSDLFDVGQQNLSDFIDAETGDIRTDELRTAAASLAEQRPQLGTNYQPPFPGDFGQGVRQGATGGASWASVLGDKRRQQSAP